MIRRKIISGIFIGILMIGAIVIGILYLRGGEDNLITEPSDDFEVTIYDLTLEEMGLTETQYQLLVDSIRTTSLEQMNVIRRRNAWLILDAMAEAEFVEFYSSEDGSRVGFATGILDLLDVGEIEELTVVRLAQGDSYMADALIIKIANENGEIYYLRYPRSSLLSRVTRDSEDGEIIYESQMFTIRNGQLCEREYARGPIISCRE